MAFEVKVPSPGESISEVEIAQWLVEEGEYVEKEQIICEIDSDKATLELAAEESGAIHIMAEDGETVAVGQVICSIDTSVVGEPKAKPAAAPKAEAAPNPMPAAKEAPAAKSDSYAAGHPSVAAKKLMDEGGVKAGQVNGTGKDGRVTKQDVLAAMAAGFPADSAQGWGGTRELRREKM
jgi:2-oxoglutarate dehydrogenase E2 component (dihydrolipoamide succinyltransferase)